MRKKVDSHPGDCCLCLMWNQQLMAAYTAQSTSHHLSHSPIHTHTFILWWRTLPCKLPNYSSGAIWGSVSVKVKGFWEEGIKRLYQINAWSVKWLKQINGLAVIYFPFGVRDTIVTVVKAFYKKCKRQKNNNFVITLAIKNKHFLLICAVLI